VGMIIAHGISAESGVKKSELIAVRSGGSYRVRALRLAGLGLEFDYRLPKAERQLLAEEPQATRIVAIVRVVGQ
jgi:hypothetical protein